MDDVTFRPFQPGDEVAINDGFNHVFGVARPLSEWQWKFPAEPEGRWVFLAVAPTGRILAHYGVVPVRVQADGLSVRAGQIVDVYSREEAHRGLGTARIFLRTVSTFIERYCNPEQLALCYGFPGTRALKLGVRRSGYDQVPPQPVTVWRRTTSARTRLFTGHTVRTGFDGDALDALWARSRGRYPLAAVRDSAWVGRRFQGRPRVEYLHFAAWRHGAPHAWAVARADAPTAQWAELIWDGEDRRALSALDRAVTRFVRGRRAEGVEMWLDGDAEAARALTWLGWEGAPHPAIRLVVHSFHPGLQPASVPGRFYVTMGDADLV